MSLKLAAITFDCHDAAALASFWSELLGVPVDANASPQLATIGTEHSIKGPALFFLQVPDKTPGKNVVHLDLTAKDWTDQVDRAVGLGAKRIGDFDESGFTWTTLADPEGNLFDIALG